MRKQEVIDHYRDIKSWEDTQLADEQLVSKFPAIINQRVQAQDRYNQLGGHEALPLPSHALLDCAFQEVTTRLRSSDRQAEMSRFIADDGLSLARIPIGQTDTPAMKLSCAQYYKASCSDAEPNFVDALRHVNSLHRGEKSLKHPRVSVYRDATGTPLCLRKSADESTAVLLQPVANETNETILPPGTIVMVHHLGQFLLTGSFSPYKTGTFKVNTLDVVDGEQLSVSPLRLSPWVYTDKLDQALFATYAHVDYVGYDAQRAKTIMSVGLDDFQEAAQQIADLCDG